MASEGEKSRKKPVIVSLIVATALAGGAMAVSASGGDGTSQESRTDGLPQKTDSIKRQDLSSRTQVDGTLGYSKERKLNGGAQGTLTWLPDTGTVIKRDEPLYEADGNKVRLMYGERPMYRKLKAGDKGPDVKQLKENLRDLGYGQGLSVDEQFTSGTADAVKRWQKAHDLKQTGETGPDQIAFAPGSVRVKKKEAAVGDQTGPGRPVLTTTGSEREVQIKLDVADADLAKPGTRVDITLPGGEKAKGKVASVDRNVNNDDKKEQGGQDKAKVTARVTFADPGQAKGFDQAPVSVDIEGEVRKDVLTVPVNALLALPVGGFGIQVVENGKTREIPVKLGMFGEGRVEISGSGLTEGMKVGVPRT
ncbi:peptidoglycan-binding protein [Streptomyces olivoreticuli]|uniref:peptidoglycan-binding protein n=1 Tax=Streptomyces olivoreticuli TaxID=68246 RepID=UPI0026584BAB|nr:peptidoglycan-binding protein [Streptomyces olivoreticuli]WKK24297.1 peptidoglycan-binding protein [Streptomyces olivoreticuli]